MEITLTSPFLNMLDAWQKHCGDIESVSIYKGSIFDVSCDAFVSPANSFGFMDGGLDAQFINYFGAHVQDRLRLQILTKHQGELLVGNAALVETDHKDHPFVIAAPTMRVPMILDSTSINPYLATRAAVLCVKHDTTSVKSIAFPGMGTGIGRVSPDMCARQMARALNDALAEKYRLPSSWSEASESHQKLYSDTVRNLQYPE